MCSVRTRPKHMGIQAFRMHGLQLRFLKNNYHRCYHRYYYHCYCFRHYCCFHRYSCYHCCCFRYCRFHRCSYYRCCCYYCLYCSCCCRLSSEPLLLQLLPDAVLLQLLSLPLQPLSESRNPNLQLLPSWKSALYQDHPVLSRTVSASSPDSSVLSQGSSSELQLSSL